jgi:hypothetical protein
MGCHPGLNFQGSYREGTVSIESLAEHEQLSLAVLIKVLVTSDGQVTQEEAVELSLVARLLDPEIFSRAESILLSDRESFLDFLETVGRQEARDIIYDTLLQLAKADGIQVQETAFLDDVAEAWNIVVVEGHDPSA